MPGAQQMAIEIEEKFFRRDRWFVRLSSKLNGVLTMPYSNYIWLQGNPSFPEIPRGYVIHHLDGDETNDSICNLVLMQKHHHVAYHLSQKIIKPEVKLKKGKLKLSRSVYFPIAEPKIYERKNGHFYVQVIEIVEGRRRKSNIYSWDEQVFVSREMAEKVKNEIWQPAGIN